MLRGILILVFGLAASGSALAQKTYHPPPKNILPGNPTTPPPSYSSPNYSSPGMAQPDYNANPNSGGGYSSAPPPAQNIPLPPCHPYDCETLQTIEEAKRDFVQCLQQSKGADGKVNSDDLEDCVFNWMAPNKFATFAECWQDTNNSAWTCFNRAYLSGKQSSSGQASLGHQSPNYGPSGRPLSTQTHPLPRAQLPPTGTQAPGGGVHPFWDCNSGSRIGPDNYDDRLLFECLAGVLTQAQLDRFFFCIDSWGRGYDFCYDHAIR